MFGLIKEDWKIEPQGVFSALIRSANKYAIQRIFRVLDQQNKPNCVGYAISSYLNSYSELDSNPDLIVQFAQICEHDKINQLVGCKISRAIEGINRFGLPYGNQSDELNFYDVHSVNVSAYAIPSFAVVGALIAGKCVLANYDVPDDWNGESFDIGTNPHCMRVIGYDISDMTTTCVNSWGPSFANNGICKLTNRANEYIMLSFEGI